MKKLLTVILLITTFQNIYANSNSPYISPGIRFGWDLKGTFSYSFKVGIGIYSSPNFYNLTIGKHFYLSKKNENVLNNSLFLYLQMGSIIKEFESEKFPLFGGGGFGFIFNKKDDSVVIYPSLTIFTGYILFITTDFTYLDNAELIIKPNIEINVPIPLRKTDIMFGN